MSRRMRAGAQADANLGHGLFYDSGREAPSLKMGSVFFVLFH